MGDHNVPNALVSNQNVSENCSLISVQMFIDKYSQIYRILLPICNTLAQIPSLQERPAIYAYIENEFGSVDNLKREILADFFRHGFDGSGADNVCIDSAFSNSPPLMKHTVL